MATEMYWWESPARPCKDRPEYADLSLVTVEPGPDMRARRKAVIRDMAESCRYCPVRAECAADDLRFADHDRHGIRAGTVR